MHFLNTLSIKITKPTKSAVSYGALHGFILRLIKHVNAQLKPS